MVSCTNRTINMKSSNNAEVLSVQRNYFKSDFDIEVNPETFTLMVKVNGSSEYISKSLSERKVSNFKKESDKISWTYEEEGIDVLIENKGDHIDVSIKSTKDDENEFTWPKISGDEYILLIGQGKKIPSNDEVWKKYFTQIESIKGIEGLSMQFFGVNKKDYGLVYIIKNPYNNEINFDVGDEIEFDFNHEFPSINEQREYGFKIYVTDKNVTDMAKVYRDYMIKNGNFKTLKEKEENNDNIKKLYGAPHVYFWNSRVIAKDNIKWQQFKNNLPEDLKSWIIYLLKEYIEDGESLSSLFDEMKEEEYINDYIKNGIINALSHVLLLKNFYNPDVFIDEISFKSDLEKGIENLNGIELVEFNKKVLKSKLKDIVDPVENWGDSVTLDVIEDMKDSGISNLLINFDDWRIGFVKPEFVKNANEYGYLIGTYESYHSIHKPGEEQWLTAAFDDVTLFDDATVMDKNGKK